MSQIVVEMIRCVKCGKTKPSKEFEGRYDICNGCSSFQSKKPVKAFCFYCHKPIYERTPHILGMTAEFTEFVCGNCFNRGKYRPRGELNYYKSCRSCKEYFYTFDEKQKFCTPKCYFFDSSTLVSKSSKDGKITSQLTSFQVLHNHVSKLEDEKKS